MPFHPGPSERDGERERSREREHERPPSLVSTFTRHVFLHQPATPAYAAALRASVVTTLPIVVAMLTSRTELFAMALGAWLVAMCDVGGAYATRARAMLAMTMGGAAVRVAALALAAWFPLAVASMFVLGVAFSLLRVLGIGPAKVGALLVVVVAISLGAPAADLHAAVAQALLFMAGGLVSTALALSLWRVHPHKPGREAVARCLVLLAEMARDLQALAHQRAAPPTWDAWVRSSHRAVRTAIESARAAVFASRVGRAGVSTMGDRLRLVVEESDRVFEGVIALGVALETLAQTERGVPAHMDALLDEVVSELHRLAAATFDPDEGRPSPRVSMPEIATRAVRAEVGGDAVGALAVTAAESILRCIDVAEDALSLAADGPEPSGRPQPIPLFARAVAAVKRAGATLRGHLTRDSYALAHSLRVGIATAATMLVMAALPLAHGAWAVVTAAACVQPWVGATWSRTAQRVAGTAAGAVLASLLARIAPAGAPTVAAIALMIFAAVALAPLNYLYFAFFVTPAFVLFTALVEQSRAPALASLRLLDGVVGGLVALASMALFFREADATRLKREIAQAIANERIFVRTAFARFLGESAGDAELAEARRQVGLANNNAEDTLQQLIGASQTREHEGLGVLVTYVRRVASVTVAALASHASWRTGRPELTAEIARCAARVDASLARGEAALRGGTVATALPRDTANALPAPLLRMEDFVREVERRALEVGMDGAGAEGGVTAKASA